MDEWMEIFLFFYCCLSDAPKLFGLKSSFSKDHSNSTDMFDTVLMAALHLFADYIIVDVPLLTSNREVELPMLWLSVIISLSISMVYI